MLNALQAARKTAEEYRRYLRSTFPLSRPDLRAEFADRLEKDFQLAKGPYLQASPPFETGMCLEELVSEGLLHSSLRRLFSASLPGDRPLYRHQELALRKAVAQRRNLMVASGTGSGKTECFLIPILNHLLSEQLEDTLEEPGIRAVLLYPMNALANDQIKRLRRLLATCPEITFGRYVGETRQDQEDAERDFRARYPFEPRLPNELISRVSMQQDPPHILLTNYAMLEYLLLRPADSPLFDGERGAHWRFVALDEIHVYSGAQGTEVAMLLRRLRDRVHGSKRGVLQCFGTSATLGRGESDYPDLIRFASDLFDEPFEWTSDDARQDVVGAARKRLVRSSARWELPAALYPEMQRAFLKDAPPAEIAGIIQAFCPEVPGPSDPGAGSASYLAELLTQDSRIVGLQESLESGAISVADALKQLFPEGDESAGEQLAALIDLGVTARHREDDSPVLPARYHFFLRAMEGAFVCLHHAHPAGEARLLLNRHDECPACRRAGVRSKMFELGVCRRCGAEYVVGRIETSPAGQRLASAPGNFSGLDYLLLAPSDRSGQENEDELAGTEDAIGEIDAIELCPSCGALGPPGVDACACSDVAKRIPVVRALPAAGADILRRCPACQGRTGGEVVYRFLSGSEPPVAVIATNLYQALGPAKDESLRAKVGEGRKLLVFSDSRQDAAFFAPYLERTYRGAVQRKLIADEIFRLGLEEPRVDDLAPRIRKTAEDCLFLDPEKSSLANLGEVNAWLMLELLAFNLRQSLEGTGTAEVKLVFPRTFEAPPRLLKLGITEKEAEDLLRMLLDTLRVGGALSVPEGVDLRDQAFSPRNREIAIRGEAPKLGIMAWSPERGTNRRLDLLERILASKGIECDAGKLLEEIWAYLTQKSADWSKVLVPYSHARHGVLWRLSHERFSFVPSDENHVPGRCDVCQQLTWRTVGGVCPQYRCPGTIRPLSDPRELDDNHYARLYRALLPIGMSVQEHTAQWVSSVASSIQDKFINGDVNVLSCSTTFELGVDVGEVEAVLLRNMPPTPANYIQRAGRAGRRTDAAALVVTYAQRRSHDLSYFANPYAMVEGVISPPFVLVDNPSIVRRHVHSVAFALFERMYCAHRTVEEFFAATEGQAASVDLFAAWLKSRPPVLGDAIRRLVPMEAAKALDLTNWAWADALLETSVDNPTFGWLTRATEEAQDDLAVAESLMEEAAADKDFRLAERYRRLRQTLAKRPLIDFLASRNVLPKYGFPVDVVSLNLARSGDSVAPNLDLSRDLKLAISEYAPGRETVAAKTLWLSKGLGTRMNRSWPDYGWAVCDECGAFRHHLGAVAEACPVCGSTQRAARRSGTFVMPVFGFVGERSPNKPGESRPRSLAVVETFFGAYQNEEPLFVQARGLRPTVGYRCGKQGRIVVVNRGPLGAGYRLCETCGFGEPVPSKVGRNPRVLRDHEDIRRPGRRCQGRLAHAHLGHQYLTDVLEIRSAVASDEDSALSALYALLEGAVALGVARADIDGTLYRYSREEPPAFVIFDAVPGGAGHAQYLGSHLADLVSAAIGRVDGCECGPETSCYGCLRSYGNQLWHDRLSRGLASRLLRSMVDA